MSCFPRHSLLILRLPILVFVVGILALPELAAAAAPALRGSSLYAVVPGPSWSEARTNALNLGGDLVTINNLPEWDAFKAHFSPANGYAYSESFSWYPDGEVQLWVGLNDIDTEGTYTWISGQTSSVPLEQLFRSPGTPSEDDYGVWQWEQRKISAYTDSVANTGWPDFAKAIRGVAEMPCARRGNSIYVVVRGPSWELAQAAAQNLGGQLATIENADENEFVRAIIDASPLKAESESGAWIGLNDVVSEGDWVWVSGSSAPFRNWQPGEPNGDNEVYTDSDYVHMYYNGLWNDHKSDGTITIGVAEIPLNAVRFFDSDGDGVNDCREEKDGTEPDNLNSFNPLSKGLVAYYPFDGNSNDESGFGNDLTLLPGSSYGADRFTATNSSLSVTLGQGAVSTKNVGISGNSSFTIAIWIKPTSDPVWPNGHLVGWGAGPDPGTMVNLVYGPYHVGQIGGSAPAGSLWVDGNYVGAGVIADPVSYLGKWSQLTVTYEGSSRSYRFYVNGKMQTGSFTTWSLELQNISDSVLSVCRGLDGLSDDLRIYNRALSENEVAQLFVNDAGCLDLNRNGLVDAADFLVNFGEVQLANGRRSVTNNPSAFNLLTQSEYEGHGALRFSNGVGSVITNPSAFSLFTQSQFDANYNSGVTAGISTVLSNPASYSLYASNSIMDLAIGALMIQKQGTNATVVFQPQSTTDLATLPFTNNGTPITNTIPMPGNKGFLRVRGVGGSFPGGVGPGGGAGND